MQNNQFYRLCDLTRLTGLSRKTLLYLVQSGKIPFIRTTQESKNPEKDNYIFSALAIMEYAIRNAEAEKKKYANDHPGEQYEAGPGCDVEKLLDVIQ